MYSIFIVEDDKSLSKQIKDGLEKWGFKGIEVDDYENIVEEFNLTCPDLVLMDINLPCFDGFYWCKAIRNISKTPIIFLSSRDSDMDIIMAVNLGGDDYLTKPFSMQVLIAKIQALLRRTYSYKEEESNLIQIGEVILNLNKGNLSYGEKNIELTKNEFKILQILMSSRGKIISRGRIMEELWESEEFISENTLSVNINRLRKKLSDIGLEEFIITKKSQGYMVE